jgi:hypothetical protein
MSVPSSTQEASHPKYIEDQLSHVTLNGGVETQNAVLSRPRAHAFFMTSERLFVAREQTGRHAYAKRLATFGVNKLKLAADLGGTVSLVGHSNENRLEAVVAQDIQPAPQTLIVEEVADHDDHASSPGLRDEVLHRRSEVRRATGAQLFEKAQESKDGRAAT